MITGSYFRLRRRLTIFHPDGTKFAAPYRHRIPSERSLQRHSWNDIDQIWKKLIEAPDEFFQMFFEAWYIRSTVSVVLKWFEEFLEWQSKIHVANVPNCCDIHAQQTNLKLAIDTTAPTCGVIWFACSIYSAIYWKEFKRMYRIYRNVKFNLPYPFLLFWFTQSLLLLHCLSPGRTTHGVTTSSIPGHVGSPCPRVCEWK